MKIYVSLVFFIICLTFTHAQSTKVAILDFENTSGKTEYDALSKAISNMLITDLANNIHPKKVEFFERSQLNKLLDEQKLQKSKNFDAKTAVDFGKLSGVNYVFVGSVFVMDKTCNFSSKLVDVQTSKIILSKDVSGNIEDFLKLKTQLAEAIASQLNNPITLDPAYKDQNTSLATLNQYGKILTTMDGGDMDKAEQMRSLFEETNPDFKYYTDIKEDIEELKKQVAKNTADIEVLNKSGDLVIDANNYDELKHNLQSNLIDSKAKFKLISDIFNSFPTNTKEDLSLLIVYPYYRKFNLDSLIRDIQNMNNLYDNSKYPNNVSDYITFRIQHSVSHYGYSYLLSDNLNEDEKLEKYERIISETDALFSKLVSNDFRKNISILTLEVELIRDNLKNMNPMDFQSSKSFKYLKNQLDEAIKKTYPEFPFLYALNEGINDMSIYKEFLDLLLGDDLAGIDRRKEMFIWYLMINATKSQRLFSVEGFRFFNDFYRNNVTCKDESIASRNENGLLVVKNCSKDLTSSQNLVLSENNEKRINTDKIKELYNLSIYEGYYFKNIFSNYKWPLNFKTLILFNNTINSKWEVLCVF